MSVPNFHLGSISLGKQPLSRNHHPKAPSILCAAQDASRPQAVSADWEGIAEAILLV